MVCAAHAIHYNKYYLTQDKKLSKVQNTVQSILYVSEQYYNVSALSLVSSHYHVNSDWKKKAGSIEISATTVVANTSEHLHCFT